VYKEKKCNINIISWFGVQMLGAINYCKPHLGLLGSTVAYSNVQLPPFISCFISPHIITHFFHSTVSSHMVVFSTKYFRAQTAYETTLWYLFLQCSRLAWQREEKFLSKKNTEFLKKCPNFISPYVTDRFVLWYEIILHIAQSSAPNSPIILDVGCLRWLL